MTDEPGHNDKPEPEEAAEESQDLSEQELSDVSGGMLRRIVWKEEEGDDDDDDGGSECTSGAMSTCRVPKTSIESWCPCS